MNIVLLILSGLASIAGAVVAIVAVRRGSAQKRWQQSKGKDRPAHI
jgi:hypothetical protein